MISKNFNYLINYTNIILKSICLNYSIVIFSSSLSVEDITLIDLILKKKLFIKIFILNTGFLNIETLNIIKYIKIYYNYNILIIFPNINDITKYIFKFGLFSFYINNNLRKECCYIRKIKLLKIVLFKKISWITGQRITQFSRTKLKIKEKDIFNNILKFNPLLYWHDKHIWKYISINKIFYNKLYNFGYSSIGCKPCTNSILINKNTRSGRWWWEKNNLKECGLHVNK